MAKIMILGAGGKAGRAAVAEAVSRGHQVTAVVRDPGKYSELEQPQVTLVPGDVTDAAAIARIAPGHDAVLSAVYTAAEAPGVFYRAAAEALTRGLTEAGVKRVIAVGIGTVLEVAPGLAMHDTEGFPAEHRAFSLGHAEELAVFAAAPADLDWLVIAPPPVYLDEKAERTGRYRIGGPGVLPGADSFSYADLAVALIDQVEAPTRHRELAAVG